MSKDKWIWAGILSVVGLLVGLVALTFWGFISQGQDKGTSQAGSTSSSAPVASATSLAAGPTAGPDIAEGKCDGPIDVDRSNPDDVAYRIMKISFCFDTTVDDSTTDAMRRASSLMSEDMQSLLVETGKNSLSGQFLTYGKVRGYTNPVVKSVGSDAMAHDHGDSEEAHVSSMYVQWYWEGRDDAPRVEGGSAVWNMRLIPDGQGGWVMDSYELGSFTTAF